MTKIDELSQTDLDAIAWAAEEGARTIARREQNIVRWLLSASLVFFMASAIPYFWRDPLSLGTYLLGTLLGLAATHRVSRFSYTYASNPEIRRLRLIQS